MTDDDTKKSINIYHKEKQKQEKMRYAYNILKIYRVFDPVGCEIFERYSMKIDKEDNAQTFVFIAKCLHLHRNTVAYKYHRAAKIIELLSKRMKEG